MNKKPYIKSVLLKRDKVESFNAYPFFLNAIKDLSTLELHPDVTFFVGENGSGKSTLLEAMAIKWGFNAEGGSKFMNFSNVNGKSGEVDHQFPVQIDQ